VLVAFFVTSVLLSRYGRRRKGALVDIGKAGPRDAWQVLANGGIATLCAVGWSFHRADTTGIWFVAFAGAYAAATADTWGTEIGTLAHDPPRSIVTGEPIATGLSGGVTLVGTFAESLGALLIALVAVSVGDRPDRFMDVAVPVFLGGGLGAVVDSLLGATLQARRTCPDCGRECETDPHVCGTPTRAARGLPWLGNDAVNFAATASGAAIAALAWTILMHLGL
jgi:uncharacterized protein (TIGR00297 family)